MNKSRKYLPTAEQRRDVMLMTGFGLSPDEIGLLQRHPVSGQLLGEALVRQLFAHEIKAGKAMTTAKVAKSLYDKAIGNGAQSVPAAVFFLKARANWRTTDRVEHVAPAGSAGVLVVPATTTPDAWLEAQSEKNRSRKAPGKPGVRK